MPVLWQPCCFATVCSMHTSLSWHKNCQCCGHLDFWLLPVLALNVILGWSALWERQLSISLHTQVTSTEELLHNPGTAHSPKWVVHGTQTRELLQRKNWYLGGLAHYPPTQPRICSPKDQNLGNLMSFFMEIMLTFRSHHHWLEPPQWRPGEGPHAWRLHTTDHNPKDHPTHTHALPSHVCIPKVRSCDVGHQDL